MGELQELQNYCRLRAWAIRVYETIAARCHGSLEEYLPDRWRLRLPASNVDIQIADSSNELIEAALIDYHALKEPT